MKLKKLQQQKNRNIIKQEMSSLIIENVNLRQQ